jgi:hypothetical protein
MNNEPKWIDINTKGEETGCQYTGSFQIKPYLNLQERSDALRLAGTYTRGFTSPSDIEFYYMLAFITFHIIGSPDVGWWTSNGLTLLDKAPIFALNNEIMKIKDPEKSTDTQAAEGSK